MSAFAVAEALDANDRERRRLALLIADIGPAELLTIVHDRWTVAATLAHLAHWDRFALGLIDRWAAGEPYETDKVPRWHEDVLNDALLDGWLALDPVEAGRLAIRATTDLDLRLQSLAPEVAARLLTDRDAEWLLRRSAHRAEHLDEIELALGFVGC